MQLSKALESQSRFAKTIGDIFGLLPGLTRNLTPHLRKRGWHLLGSMEPRYMQHLMVLANAGDYSALDQAMENAGRHYLAEIETRAVSTFPNRREILADAFEAHRSEKYTLSVPAMLIQADGIGAEVLEIVDNFFRRGKSNKKALESLACRFGSIDDAFFEILREEPAFVSRHPDIEPTIDRHLILHGKCTTYHTESNSLRAAVLLGYLTDASRSIEQWRQSESEFREEIRALKVQLGLS